MAASWRAYCEHCGACPCWRCLGGQFGVVRGRDAGTQVGLQSPRGFRFHCPLPWLIRAALSWCAESMVPVTRCPWQPELSSTVVGKLGVLGER